MDNTTIPGLKTSYPYEGSSPGVARHQCEECGAWQRADKADKGLLVGEISHGRRCESRPQPPAVAAVLSERAAKEHATRRDRDLRRFADQVRRTGITHGRADDVLECVRLGYLTETQAMNADD